MTCQQDCPTRHFILFFGQSLYPAIHSTFFPDKMRLSHFFVIYCNMLQYVINIIVLVYGGASGRHTVLFFSGFVPVAPAIRMRSCCLLHPGRNTLASLPLHGCQGCMRLRISYRLGRSWVLLGAWGAEGL